MVSLERRKGMINVEDYLLETCSQIAAVYSEHLALPPKSIVRC